MDLWSERVQECCSSDVSIRKQIPRKLSYQQQQYLHIFCSSIPYCWLGSFTQRSSQWAFQRGFSRFQKVSGEENGERRTLMITGFLASIHVSTFYFKGADKGRMMLIECPKCPLLTYFCPILLPRGVREAADHTPQQGLSQKPRRPTGQGQACPHPLVTPNNV